MFSSKNPKTMPALYNLLNRRSSLIFNSSIKKELIRLIIINISLFAQHVNLFYFDLSMYNTKIFLYTLCITIQPFLSKLREVLKPTVTEKTAKFLQIVRIVQIAILLSNFVLLFKLYNFLTPSRAVFIFY